MSRDAIGVALSVMNNLASSSVVDQLGLRKWLEKVAYKGTKVGFQAATAINRQFKSLPGLKNPVRMAKPKGAKVQLFDLAISDEQQMIRDNVSRFAKEVLRPAAESADAKRHTETSISQAASELGLAYYSVAEELGGAGVERSPVTNMLVAEDLAYGDMGLAVALLAPLSVANVLSQWGSAAQQAKYLPAFLDEERPLQAAIAVNEANVLFDPVQLTTRAQSNAQGYLINGEKSLVPLAQSAELFLVAAQLVGKGPALFLIESSTPGLSITEDNGMGLRAAGLAKLCLQDVQLNKDAILGELESDFDYCTFLDYARLAWCSVAIGTCQAVLDYVIGYCNERVAFGEPISHRQAVAFMIADMGVEIEGMRIITQRAVSRAENGMTFHKEAYLAAVACADKAMQIGTDGVQLLGGHGFTKEHPVERWYRDLRAISVMQGGLHL